MRHEMKRFYQRIRDGLSEGGILRGLLITLALYTPFGILMSWLAVIILT